MKAPPSGTPDLSSPAARVLGFRTAAGDGVVLAYLVSALVVSVFFDGGLGGGGPLMLGGTAVLAAPVIAVEIGRSARPLRLLMLMWGLGILMSVAFAVHRADMTEAILTYALPPFAFFAVRRLRRHRWGPRVLVAVLAVAATAYWLNAFSTWLGPPSGGVRSNWLAVLWHNPTGALMGSFGLLALAIGTSHRLRWAVPAATVSGLSFAGLWLTGSRGAFVATVLGLAVTVAASRDVGWRRMAATGLTVFLAATLAVAVLLPLKGIRSASDEPRRTAVPVGLGLNTPGPVIDPSASQNLRARFAHVDAALELFSEHPLTGAGLGAYGELGNRSASSGANLTLSAHNEFAEALAEGGLLFGVPFLIAAVAVGAVALRRTGSLHDRDAPEVPGLSAGAAGVAVLLLVHTAFDIDWGYPVIPALLAAGAAILWDRRETEVRSPIRSLAAAPLIVALALGVTAAITEAWFGAARATDRSDLAVPAAPWDLYRRVHAARSLAADGDLAVARAVMEPAARWNASSPRLDVMQAVIAYRETEIDAIELTSKLGGQATGAYTYVLVAEALLDRGHLDRAGEVIEEGFDLSLEHAGTPYARAQLWELRLRHAIAARGCPSADAILEGVAADDRVRPYVDDVEDQLRRIIEGECGA